MAPLPLLAYRVAMLAALPLLALVTLLPRRGGPALWAERFGIGPARPGALWLHAASNGEAASARRLLETLLAEFPGLEAVVTTHTVTGRALVASWGIGRVHARLAPWDAWPGIAAFMRRWRPCAHLVIESEIWPERLLACQARGIPTALISARLSERSAARWAAAPRSAERLLGTLEGLAPQDEASAARFASLGLPPAALWPVETLKADLPDLERPNDWDRLRAAFPRERTVIAASTHEGEEALAIAAWDRVPGLRLILAPRHPRRLPEVLAAIGARPHTLRGSGRAPEGIYVIDTLGELRALYGLAAMAFVGGSVAPRGGHTPFEPVAEGCVVIHGPDTRNAAPAYEALRAADAALRIEDEEGLASAFALTADPARLAAMADRARAALSGRGGETTARALRLVRDARRGA